jgi:hypothetical protein
MTTKKLMIGTPAYGGQISLDYHISSIQTTVYFETIQNPILHQFVENSSLVMDARNEIVYQFLHHEENPTHLLFIDADIEWEVGDILELLKYSDENFPVLSGLYPKKELDFNLLTHGLRTNKDPNFYTGTLDGSMFSPVEENFDMAKPIEVTHAGCGFLLIQRDVFTRLQESYSNLFYTARNRSEFLFFDTHLVEEPDGSRKHYGEDTYFCKLCRDIGIPIHVLSWVALGHKGGLTYRHPPTAKPNR